LSCAKSADGNDEDVIPGNGLSPSMSLKIASKLGTMKTRRKPMITDGHGHDDGRVNHRGKDFAFDLLRLFLELGQSRQHDLEYAAESHPLSPC
jgi:hypothetical protein